MATSPEPGPFGVLLIDKPLGPTSHDVVGWVRWALRERSVGHCGTLDPAASGLLVVCVGPATKLVEYLTGVDKRYRARFVLGRSTTTADAEGEILAEAPVGDEQHARAWPTLLDMVGPLELPPPAFSAVKIEGRRAHELARAGAAPELPVRPMALHAVELVGQGRGPDPGSGAWIDAIVDVAKGTYVRSLAEELGRRLGVPAHLGALERLACGDLALTHPSALRGVVATRLPDAEGHEGRPPRWRLTLPDASERESIAAALRARILAPWTCLPFETLVLDQPDPATAKLIERLRQGQRLGDGRHLAGLAHLAAGTGLCALVSGRELLIARREQGLLVPVRRIAFPVPTPDAAEPTWRANARPPEPETVDSGAARLDAAPSNPVDDDPHRGRSPATQKT